MSAVNTLEAVERKASIVAMMALRSFGEGSAGRDILNETAAMLRRLHTRVVEAERERDAAILDRDKAQAHAFRSQQIARDQAIEAHNAENKCEQLEAALATARADALREAAAAIRDTGNLKSCGEVRAAILALIPEKPHAE